MTMHKEIEEDREDLAGKLRDRGYFVEEEQTDDGVEYSLTINPDYEDGEDAVDEIGYLTDGARFAVYLCNDELCTYTW